MKIAKWFANITILGTVTILAFFILDGIIGYRYVPTKLIPSPYYYAILATLLIFSLASLGLRESHRINVALTLGSIMATLYVLELVLISRSFSPALVAENFNVSFDTRTRLEVIEQFEREGIEAFPPVSRHDIIRNGYLKIDGKDVLPLAGVSDVLTVSCNETGEYLIYQSDEHGFHNPKGLYNVKDLSIVAVGDSYTHGSCVKSEKNAVSIIRNVYENTLNLGKGGYGPLTQLAALKEYAEPLKPKIVIWVYFEGNDLNDLNKEKESDLLLRYLEKDYKQNLLAIQPKIDDELVKLINNEKEKVKAYENMHPLLKFLLLDRLHNKLGKYLAALDNDSVDLILFRKVLASAKNLTSSWGGEFYFVYLPSTQRFKSPDSVNPYHDQVLLLVDDLDIPTIDVTNAFAAHPDPLALNPFRGHGHYNEEGYQLFGETVLQFIEERSSLTPLQEVPVEKVGFENN